VRDRASRHRGGNGAKRIKRRRSVDGTLCEAGHRKVCGALRVIFLAERVRLVRARDSRASAPVAPSALHAVTRPLSSALLPTDSSKTLLCVLVCVCVYACVWCKNKLSRHDAARWRWTQNQHQTCRRRRNGTAIRRCSRRVSALTSPLLCLPSPSPPLLCSRYSPLPPLSSASPLLPFVCLSAASLFLCRSSPLPLPLRCLPFPLPLLFTSSAFPLHCLTLLSSRLLSLSAANSFTYSHIIYIYILIWMYTLSDIYIYSHTYPFVSDLCLSNARIAFWCLFLPLRPLSLCLCLSVCLSVWFVRFACLCVTGSFLTLIVSIFFLFLVQGLKFFFNLSFGTGSFLTLIVSILFWSYVALHSLFIGFPGK